MPANVLSHLQQAKCVSSSLPSQRNGTKSKWPLTSSRLSFPLFLLHLLTTHFNMPCCHFFKLRTSENNMTILPPTPIPHSKFPDSFIGAMIPPIFQVISDLCNSRSINFRFSREVIKTLWLTGKSIDYSVGHLHPRKPHVLEYSTNIIGIPPEPKRLHLSGSE